MLDAFGTEINVGNTVVAITGGSSSSSSSAQMILGEVIKTFPTTTRVRCLQVPTEARGRIKVGDEYLVPKSKRVMVIDGQRGEIRNYCTVAPVAAL